MFWDLQSTTTFSSRHSKNEVCFSPCQLRQLARVARCWIIVGKERASSLLRGSNHDVREFPFVRGSQHLALNEWLEQLFLTPFGPRLHGSWCGNCPFGGGNCNNWFQRDFWILRFDQLRMNRVQFLQGAIGVSLGVSRTIELHTWRAQIFVLSCFGGVWSVQVDGISTKHGRKRWTQFNTNKE